VHLNVSLISSDFPHTFLELPHSSVGSTIAQHPHCNMSVPSMVAARRRVHGAAAAGPRKKGTSSRKVVKVKGFDGIVHPRKSVAVSAIHSAIAILKNSRPTTPTGRGLAAGSPEGKVVYDAALLGVARGMFSPGHVHKFDVQSAGTISTTGAGALFATLSIDPNTTSYLEWSTLALLFDEVKAYRASLVLITASPNSTGTNIQVPIAVAVDQQNISASYTQASAILRLAGSDFISSNLMTSGSGRYERRDKFCPRQWGTTQVPSEHSPPTGCVGAYALGGFVTGTVSVAYFSYVLCVKMEFRARA
jgi:hypothetical protein